MEQAGQVAEVSAGRSARISKYTKHIRVVVVLAGDKAYKAKKPIATEFLDFSTVDRRERACAPGSPAQQPAGTRELPGSRALEQTRPEVLLSRSSSCAAIPTHGGWPRW